EPVAVLFEHVAERPDPARRDDLEQLLPAVREVLAQHAPDRGAAPGELAGEQLVHHGHAAAAAGARAGALLDLGHRRQLACADRAADRAGPYRVARADRAILERLGGHRAERRKLTRFERGIAAD